MVFDALTKLRAVSELIGECGTTLPKSLPSNPQTEFGEIVDKKDCKSQKITTKPVKKPRFSLIIEINTSVLNKSNVKTAFRDNFVSTTTNGSIDAKIVGQEDNLKKQHIFSTSYPQFSRTEDRTILDYNNISLELANNPAEFLNTDSQDEMPGTPSSTSSTVNDFIATSPRLSSQTKPIKIFHTYAKCKIQKKRTISPKFSNFPDNNNTPNCYHKQSNNNIYVSIVEEFNSYIKNGKIEGHRNNNIEHEKNNEDVTSRSNDENDSTEITEDTHTAIDITKESSPRQQPIEITTDEETSTSAEDSSSSEQEQSLDDYPSSQPSHFKSSKKSTETSNSRPTEDPIDYNHIIIQEQTRGC
ncbi:10984_t:CDS:2 [Dentiscutata erythropus]|uniref:10984_t:CDS:1 n=1 Tax=Dentiscutata erythropus TaxID=1348616 RepID=A0A9N9B339_9GLOM|nr:10984_t:CDS:2 [Dentiscutata erythropus]